jgi:phage-related protein
MWSVHYDPRLDDWFDTIPADVKARILRIADMLAAYGPSMVREPYVKAIKGHKKLFEIRAKSKDGIARVFYFTREGQRIILLHGFLKRSMKTPAREIDIALQRMKEVAQWLD